MKRTRSRTAWLALPCVAALAFVFAYDGAPRPRKILITAFEAYDGLPDNMSERVLEEIRRRHGDRFDYLVLPVDRSAEPKLRRVLRRRRPIAVISLGEDVRLRPSTCNLEPFALDAKLKSGVHKHTQHPKVHSPWAAEIATELGMKLTPGWGTYYCNRIHRLALLWAKQRAPALFIHVARNGEPATMASSVLRMVDALKLDAARRVRSADVVSVDTGAPHGLGR